jgi:rRNA maturation endonuclease Nob1
MSAPGKSPANWPMKCVQCGYFTSEPYNYCPHCGTILNTAPELRPYPEVPYGRSRESTQQ